MKVQLLSSAPRLIKNQGNSSLKISGHCLPLAALGGNVHFLNEPLMGGSSALLRSGLMVTPQDFVPQIEGLLLPTHSNI